MTQAQAKTTETTETTETTGTDRETQAETAQAQHTNAFAEGERVIYQCPAPEWDGLRGVVTEARPGGYYAVRFDDGRVWPQVWESKLAREADEPNYPLPAPPAA